MGELASRRAGGWGEQASRRASGRASRWASKRAAEWVGGASGLASERVVVDHWWWWVGGFLLVGTTGQGPSMALACPALTLPRGSGSARRFAC
jgi:hypothetical protein